MATLLGKAIKWGKKNVGKVAAVALPVAALATSLLPGVGGAISTGLSKVGDKLKGSKVLSAVSKVSDTVSSPDTKKGFLGIADDKPGILGLFTGKRKAKKALENRTENEAIYNADDQSDLDRLRALGKVSGTPALPGVGAAAYSPQTPDTDSGVSPLAIAAGIGFVLWLTNK